jgi:hypothetical protein
MANPRMKDAPTPNTPSGPTPDLATGVAWAFTYDGPTASVDDRSCACCNAASSGTCGKSQMQHGSDSRSCPSCYAAKVGRCDLHCGAVVALQASEVPSALEAIAKSLQATAIQAIADRPDCIGAFIKATVFYDVPDLIPGDITLSVKLRK